MAIPLFTSRTGSDLTSGNKLRFNVRDEVLAKRRLQFGAARVSRALLPEDGISVSVLSTVSQETLSAVAQIPKLRTSWNKLMRSFGAIMVADSERIVRRAGTIETGLTLSGFQVAFREVAGLIVEISLTQLAPYFKYIHPAGRKGRTLFRVEFRAQVPKWEDRFADDLNTIFKPILAAAEKARIVSTIAGGGR